MNNLKISIVTPSLNQGRFIEDTILSVLNQNYPNYEHIIVDGGSTDNTIEILKRYEHLRWISEKDTGQSNAINKGFRLVTGDIVAWLNSDDYYDVNIFATINDYFRKNSNCMILYGDITYINSNKEILYRLTGDTINRTNLLKHPDIVRQPSCFWRRNIIEEVGYLDENLHLVMDFDYFLRISQIYRFHYINKNISFYRCYEETKTISMLKKQTFELYRVIRRNSKIVSPFIYKYLLGKYLDSLDESNILRRILSPLRKGKE